MQNLLIGESQHQLYLDATSRLIEVPSSPPFLSKHLRVSGSKNSNPQFLLLHTLRPLVPPR